MFSAALSSSPKTLPPLAPLRKPDRSSACHDRGFNRLPTIPALMAIFFNSPSKKNSSYKGKNKKFTERPFLPQNSEHVYQQRCDYKKKRRKAQQHKLAKNPTFVSCVAKAKKNIYSKRRKEREKKSKGRLPVNG
jgi:hypothetical protein